MESEFADRPVFGLDEQIKIMDRAKGKSDVDTWLGNIGEFMKSVGTIPEVPDAKSFIDDSYMKTRRRRSDAQGDGDEVELSRGVRRAGGLRLSARAWHRGTP